MEKPDFRDVDVRLILPDEEYDALFGGRPGTMWELLSLSLGDYLRQRTGLPIDFQIQRRTEANAKHAKRRNPLGMSRSYAGGGDATPADADARHADQPEGCTCQYFPDGHYQVFYDCPVHSPDTAPAWAGVVRLEQTKVIADHEEEA